MSSPLAKYRKRRTMFSAMMSERVKGHVSSLLAASLFGLMSPMSKLAMASGVIDGVTLATFRVIGSAILFWFVSLFVEPQHIRLRDW